MYTVLRVRFIEVLSAPTADATAPAAAAAPVAASTSGWYPSLLPPHWGFWHILPMAWMDPSETVAVQSGCY
jgi:hypothetical protein